MDYRGQGSLGRGLAKDPALLNRVAWACRWQSRARSFEYANLVRKVLDGETSREARIQSSLADLTLSWQAKWRGDFDDALDHALTAERHLDEIAYPEARGELYSIMGVVHYSRNRLDLADGVVQRGLALVTPELHGDAYVDLLTSCATIHRHGGDLRSAGEVLGKARQIARGTMLARVEHNVARWMLSDDAPAHALDHAETSIELAKTHQNNVIMPYAHEVAGACFVELEEYAFAEEHFTEALDYATADNDFRAQCQILGCFAALEKKTQLARPCLRSISVRQGDREAHELRNLGNDLRPPAGGGLRTTRRSRKRC